MIHCGSRGLGHQIASDYIKKMEEGFEFFQKLENLNYNFELLLVNKAFPEYSDEEVGACDLDKRNYFYELKNYFRRYLKKLKHYFSTLIEAMFDVLIFFICWVVSITKQNNSRRKCFCCN